MENQGIVYNQCRFCLKLIEEFASFSIFSAKPRPNSLYLFVQQMLRLEFTAENSHVCRDCFAVWHMIQDYVQACACANQVLALSTGLTVRKAWLDNGEETQMLIGVCQRVKKLCHEMGILLKTVKNPPKRRRKRRQSDPVAQPSEQSEALARKDATTTEETGVKAEEAVEIDDSDAFQTDDPLEARRNDMEDRLSMESAPANVEAIDDPSGDANESIDDSVTIIEATVDHIDLVDSSSEEELDGDEDDETDRVEEDYSGDSLPAWQKKDIDINVLKTVCQICGATTNDMASHLEGHIIDDPPVPRKPPAPKVQTESDSSASDGSLKPKRKRNAAVEEQGKPASSQEQQQQKQPLKCDVCGTEFVSLLAAKLHARSHPLNWTIDSSSRAYDSVKSRPVVRRAYR
nr:uncharacterized protein LOC109428429 isoform X1 [Aedes albopictus]